MITCKTLDSYFQQKVDMAFSGYLDPIKKNRVFYSAMVLASSRKYLTLDEQKSFDELAGLITTQSVFPINGNQISTAALPIISAIATGASIIFKTFFPHNISIGDSTTISSVQGLTTNPVTNGTFIVASVIDAYTFTVAIISGTGTSTTNTGQASTSKLISDYMHLEAVKCKFIDPLFGVQVVRTSNISPINIFFKSRQKLRDKTQIQLSDMGLTPSANGTFFTKKINDTGYALYKDSDLQIASTGGNVTKGNQGKVNIVWYEYAKPYISDRKIDKFEVPAPWFPKYETANKVLKFYPLERQCVEITADYIKKPFLLFTDIGGNQVPIDVLDDKLDMELYYPAKYLFWVIDWTIRQFSTPLRDQLLNAEITADLVEQP